MPRLKRKATKERLLRRVRKQRVKHITVLPSLVTILNGVCGFTAIVFASKGTQAGIGQLSHFAMACYMILAAMIADMLDGRLARISQNTSSFGGQLDSLCDTISFGVAPAFLMLKVLEHKLAGFAELNLASGSFLQRFIWVAAAAYVSCAAIRLARFNVENEEDESAHMSFVGLPSPAAAGVLVSLVIFQQQTLPELFAKNPQAYLICENAIVYTLPFLALSTAILMVSRIQYPHILNQYLKGKKPFAHLIWALLFLALIVWSRLAALAVIFCGFAASSFVKWLYYKVSRRKKFIPVGQSAAADLVEQSEAQLPK
jgi:CDP-diacylglycerol--serine O-phosphatidyltransferase